MPEDTDDTRLLETFLTPIHVCAQYRPAFGLGRREGGVDLEAFRELYGSDSFYSWLGLDDPSVYAAHKAAGGLTSLYRQIGVGSERLFRDVVGATLDLSEEQMEWSYRYPTTGEREGLHKLDAKIELADLDGQVARTRFEQWLSDAAEAVEGNSTGRVNAEGAVFEVRQGYKSADSKRQAADIRFGGRAYQAGLLPVFCFLSEQLSLPVVRRYRGEAMLVLTGVDNDDPLSSTYSFFREVVGYDLSAFFERNSPRLQEEIKQIVEALLSA